MSATEVTNLRKPGDLVFSLDNEIMTVSLASGVNATPGKAVTFDSNNYAILATDSNLDITKGVGIVIHEGADNTDGADGDKLVQIATGNAYVVMEAGGAISPFNDISVDSNSDAVSYTLGTIASGTDFDTISEIGGEVEKIWNYVKCHVGKSYGKPGEMVNPGNVADGDPVVVRLGK